MTTTPWMALPPEVTSNPPHRLGGNTHHDIMRAWMLAAGIVATCGVVLFGLGAVRVLAVSIATAVLTDLIVSITTRRPVIGGLSHAGLMGLLLGLTLPATAEWYIPMIGSLVAIGLAKGLFGGLGHYIWQPALVGRVVVGFLFMQQLAYVEGTPQSAVLARDRLLFGQINQVHPVDIAHYPGWQDATRAVTTDALTMHRPVDVLREFAEGDIRPDDNAPFETLIRDHLPPWPDTIFGTVPGAIGETGALAIVVAGMYLIYRGYLRWELPVTMLAAAAVTAGVLPVQTYGQDAGYDWFPALADEHGRAVGLAYVLYHLTTGQLMLGAFLLAGDMMSTPMRARGQMVFAAGVGVLTIFMRLYGVIEGEAYWSILIMNSVVYWIDHRFRRPVLGVVPARPAAEA